MSKLVKGAKKQAKKFGSSVSGNIGDILSGDIQGGFEGLLENQLDFFTVGAYSKAKEIYELIKQGVPEQTFEGRDRMANGNDTPRQFVYGKCRIGGQLDYWEPTGADKSKMHMIIVLAPHGLNAINEIYFNDDLAFNSAGVAQGDFAGKATVYKVKEPRLTALPEAVAALVEWTESHILKDHSYIYVVLDYDRDAYSRGLPNVSTVVEGKNDIYDPRTQTRGYTRNHALVTLDYLTTYEGVRSTLDETLTQSFIDGANVCDEPVAAENGTEPRYTVDGTLSYAAAPLENLVSLLRAGGAFLNFDQGTWQYVAGTYTAPNPDFDFDESDLVGGISFEAGASKANIINTAKGSFLDPTQNYNKTQYTPISPSAIDGSGSYATLDGEELVTEFNAPFSTTSTNARRLAKLAIEQSRFGIRCQVTLKPRAMELISGDRLTLSIARLGWDKKVFRVVAGGFSMSLSGGVSLSLQEDAPSVWDWQEGDVQVISPPPALILPDSAINPPTDLAVSESLYTTTNINDVKTRATVSWVAGGVRSNVFEVQFRPIGEAWQTLSTDWRDTQIDANDVQIGPHEIRVRGVTETGRVSDWTTLNYTIIGKDSPPSDVPSISAAQKSYGVDIAWQAVPDLDVLLYEVRLDENFGSTGAVYSGRQLNFTDQRRLAGTTYFVRAFDTSGNYSENSASFSPSIQGPTVVGSLGADSSYNNVFLKWASASSIYPVATYLIRKGEFIEDSQPIGESSGTFEAIIEQENGIFRYWVQARDAAGNIGPAISALANVDAPPDYVLRADDYVDFNQMDVLTNIVLGDGGGGLRWDDTTLRWDDTSLRWDDGPSIDLIGPVNATETFIENMARSGLTYDDALSWGDTTQLWDDTTLPWDALGGDPYGQKEINGFTHWLEPSLPSAYAERVIDFGALIPNSRVTVTVDETDLVVGATLVTTLSTSPDGVAWDVFTPDQLELNSSNFRYLRIALDIDAPTSVGIIRINNVRFRLDVKQKTDQGTAVINGADFDPNDPLKKGTLVYLNKSFIDLDSVVATPKAADAKIAVAQFDDIGNPEFFWVIVFDRATGDSVDAIISWQARGS